MDEANVIIFVADGKTGLVDSDRFIAKMLYDSNKPVILAVNKIDDVNQLPNIYEFYALGLGDPIAISSHHGIGTGDLLDKVVSYMDEPKPEIDDDAIHLAIVGRPNVGKSSLTNAILGEERVIVSDISGTTRDAIDTRFKKDKQEYVVIDTAGIKKRGKIYENADKYSVLRALSALDRSDIALLILDGEEGIIEQDKHVAGFIKDANKGVVIVVNKWDLIEKNDKTMAKMEKKIKAHFQFFPYAEVVFISAKHNDRIKTIYPAIKRAYASYTKRIQTSILNDLLMDATAMNPTSIFNHGKASFSYMTQVGIKPPTFLVFVNHPDYVHFSYLRYLNNQFRQAIDFTGSPIKLVLRKKA